jgi:nucleoside-diphosphate-sugar epimerase
MEKILLIGGFGFIGKNLIEQLSGEYEIHVIGRRLDSDFMSMYPNIKFHKYVFMSDEGIADVVALINPDYIINLVSIVTASRNMKQYKEMIDMNINVLLELYEATKSIKQLKLFLQFGSGEEYGNIEAPYRETDREFPSSPYALSKQLTTNTALMLYNNFSFPISVVRPGNLFGDYQESNKFIPYIINKLSNNEVIETTYGEQERDFIYAEDFAIGIKKVIESHKIFIGEIFNLSAGKSFKLKEIIEYCKNYLRSSSVIEYGKIPYRENEMMKFKLDISKFKELTKSNFEIDVLESLSRFIDKNGGYRK